MAIAGDGRVRWHRLSVICLFFAALPIIYSATVPVGADDRTTQGHRVNLSGYRDKSSPDLPSINMYISTIASPRPNENVAGAATRLTPMASDRLVLLGGVPVPNKDIPSKVTIGASASKKTLNTNIGGYRYDISDGPLIFSPGCESGNCHPITRSNSRQPAGSGTNTFRLRPPSRLAPIFATHRPEKPIFTNWRLIDGPAGGGVRQTSPRGDVRQSREVGDVLGKPTSFHKDAGLQTMLFMPGSLLQHNKNVSNLVTAARLTAAETKAFSPAAVGVNSASQAGHESREISTAPAFFVRSKPPSNGGSASASAPPAPLTRSRDTDNDTPRLPHNAVVQLHGVWNQKGNLIIGVSRLGKISVQNAAPSPPLAVDEPSGEYKADIYNALLSIADRPPISRTNNMGTQTRRNQVSIASAKIPLLRQTRIGYSKANSLSRREQTALKQTPLPVTIDEYLRKSVGIGKQAAVLRFKRDTDEYVNRGTAEDSEALVVPLVNASAEDISGQRPTELHNQSSQGISLRSEGLVGLVDPSHERARFGDIQGAGSASRFDKSYTADGESGMSGTVSNATFPNISAAALNPEDSYQMGSGNAEETGVEPEWMGGETEAPPDSLPMSDNDTLPATWPLPTSPSNSTLNGTWLDEDNFSPGSNYSWTDGEQGGLSGDRVDTWPESGPELGPDPEPEGNAEAEPTAVSWDCRGPSCSFSEPIPDWEAAKGEWQAAWEIHVYGAGILFAVLAVYALISIIGLVRRRDLMSQGYFISLNVMLLIMCAARAVYFLVDGYNSGGTFHPIIAYFLYTIAFPCLTSAFSVLFLALLQTLKMQLLSPKIQKPSVLVGIITFHFALSIVTDVAVGLIADNIIMLVVCEVFFVLWGVFLFCAYIYIFRKLYVAAQRRHKELSRLAISQTKLAGSEEPAALKHQRPVFNTAVKITLVTAILGLISAGLEVYAIIGLLRSVRHDVPDPWPWWGVHLGGRLVEVGMCVTMSYVATQPFRHQPTGSAGAKQSTSCLDIIYFVPCHRCCSESTKDQYVSAPTECSYTQQQMTYNPAYGYVNEYIYNTANSANGIQPPGEDVTVSANNLSGSLKSKSLDSKAERKRKSMLVNDEGFVRFRQDGDPEGEFIVSTDDELNSNDGVLANGVSMAAGGVKSNGAPCTTLTYYIARTAPGSPRRFHSISVPNTGDNTPATPRSYCSTDFELDMAGSEFGFRPPSSIHLRESIEGALNYYPRFTLKTPDYLETPDSLSRPRTPDDLDAEDYHSAKSGPSDTPDQARRADLSPSASGTRLSTRSMGDVKTTWFHKSPKNYWRAISQARARSSNLSLASRSSSRYSPLDDAAQLSSRQKNSELYLSNSESLAGTPKTEEDVNV